MAYLPFKSTKSTGVTYTAGANIDPTQFKANTIAVAEAPTFTGEVSGAQYNLQAGTGLTFDGLKYSVVASSNSGLKATGQFTLLSYVKVAK